MKKTFIKRFVSLILAVIMTLGISTSALAADCVRYYGSSGSIVDICKSLGLDSSFNGRTNLWNLNGTGGTYRGTASQNSYLCKVAKSQGLRVNSGTASTQGTADKLINGLGAVSFQRQGAINCKSTSAAMMACIIAGRNSFNSNSLGGNNCMNLNGRGIYGSNGHIYAFTYKTDSYKGSRNEAISQVETSLKDGLPVIAAVHSTKRCGTRHHWILIVGKKGSEYLVVDPATGKNNTAISGNVQTMSGLCYDFGLTDYSNGTHYGYISCYLYR